MELDELNESKRVLQKKSANYRSQLEDEAKFLSDRAEKILTNTLIIGGALALSYFVVTQFSKSKKTKSKLKRTKVNIIREPAEESEDEPVEESRFSQVATEIGSALANQATTFLLNLAKEKLMEYLESKAEKKLTKDEHP